MSPDAPTFRPALAVGIARIASYWSDIELHWAVAFTYLLGGKERDAFAEYYTLRDWKKRRSKFLTAATNQKLPGPLKTQAQDLYADFEIIAIGRNKIVHGAWAWSPQFEHSLFLAQPRELGHNLNRTFTAIENIATRPKQYRQVTIDLSRGSYEEYQHEDFETVVKEMIDFRVRLQNYSSEVLNHSLQALKRRLQPGS